LNRPKEYRERERSLPKGIYLRGDKFVAKLWEQTTGDHIHVGTFDSQEEAEYARNVEANGHHWTGEKLDPEAYWGFLYLITCRTSGKKYIGRKQYRLWDGPTGGYKCTDPRDTEWFSPKVWKANNWQFYTGSSNKLNKDVGELGVTNFTFEILEQCWNKLDLHLAEVLKQMELDVLEAVDAEGNYTYYNENIAGMEFRAPFVKAEVVAVTQKSIEDLHKYYLKPRMCLKCGAMIPYKENCSC